MPVGKLVLHWTMYKCCFKIVFQNNGLTTCLTFTMHRGLIRLNQLLVYLLLTNIVVLDIITLQNPSTMRSIAIFQVEVLLLEVVLFKVQDAICRACVTPRPCHSDQKLPTSLKP